MKDMSITQVTLYSLSDYGTARRFDDFRKIRGLPTYFTDEQGNFVSHYSVLLDRNDLSELDRAFLVGAQAECCQGIRIEPWPAEGAPNPHLNLLDKYLSSYTIWPGQCALVVVEHALIAFLGLAHAIGNDTAPVFQEADALIVKA